MHTLIAVALLAIESLQKTRSSTRTMLSRSVAKKTRTNLHTGPRRFMEVLRIQTPFAVHAAAIVFDGASTRDSIYVYGSSCVMSRMFERSRVMTVGQPSVVLKIGTVDPIWAQYGPNMGA